MKDVIKEIHGEHATMARLLNILDQQVEVFEAGGQPDYAIVEDIVLYFLTYPDQCHHPKEDLLARKLLEKVPDKAARLRGLAELHEELSQLTRKVAGIVRGVLNDQELPRDEVVRATKEFIDSQRHHMEMEEEHFLPLAEQALSQSDLAELSSDLFEGEDPLFGSKAEEHYAMLRERILKSEQDR